MAEEKPNAEPRYIASVRTALSDPSAALYKELPKDYVQSSVKEVLDYMLSDKKGDDAQATSSSVKRVLANRSGYTITVGDKTVAPDESVADLFSDRERKGVTYKALDMELATNQEGGLARFLG